MADPLLFQPFTLRNLEIRNRVWAAPMCQYSADAEDGVPVDWHFAHLAGLARGGAGLVVTEATAVVPEGRISPRDLGLWNETQEAAFSRIADAVHAHGARIGVQLAHAGRKASTYPALPGFERGTVPASEGGWQTVAPSAVAFEGFDEPRALEADELPALVDAFVDASTRAVRAGIDVVQVHAAHGYLLHEFLSPLSNRREDGYGGDLVGRARIVREIVRAIRAEHPNLPIVVRVSAEDWVDGGFSVDEAETLAGWLAEDDADLIDVSSGGNSPTLPPRIGPSYQVGLADQVRRGPLPVGAVGLITSATQAEGILATGQADVVSLARPLLVNPHLPIVWAHELRAPHADALVPGQYARARF